jgi:MFS family permease
MSTTMRGACTARVRSVQKTGLTLIFLICVLNYMDRGTLSVANPLIRRDLGLSVAAMGALLSAFLWPYAFALLAAGDIVDRHGPRRVLTISLVVWSVAQAAAGFVVSYTQFLIARAMLGVGEAPIFPTATLVVKDWFHEGDQALGVGIWNGAPSLGTAIAPALLTPIRLASWGQLFSFRSSWGLILGFFGNVYIGWLFIAWLPGYLELQRHMSIPKTGFIASIPFVCGLVGSIPGGWGRTG